MKKKSVALLLALCLLLSGCGGQPSAQPSGRPSEAPPATAAPAETGTPAPALTLMDGREPAGGEGNAWYIPNGDVESMRSPEPQLLDERTLLLSSAHIEDSGCWTELKLISLEDGSLLAEAAFPGSGYDTVRVGEGTVGLCDSEKGAVRILDRSLTPVKTYEPEADGENWYLSRDMETLYIFRYDRGLFARDLESGEERPLLDNAARVYTIGHTDRYLLFSYVDMEDQRTYCRSLDLDTGALDSPPLAGAVSWGSRVGDTWLLNSAAQWEEYRLMAGEQTSRIRWAGNWLMLLEPRGLLLTADDSGRELTLYGTDGSFLSRCTLSREGQRWTGADFVWSDLWNGYFFLDYGNDGQGRLTFWEPGGESRGEDLPLEAGEEPVPGGVSVSRELYDRAAELSRRFGVDVRLADQCALDYDGYTAYAVSDEGALAEALDVLERALAAYPAGFLEQLNYDSIRTIRIELVGGLSAKADAPESIAAAAFTHENVEYYLMVADVYMFSESVVYHEFSHIIDRRLAWDAGLREGALYSEERWLELQPDGFQYAWSYRTIPDSVTAYYGSGYFVKDYACTFPTEDRATLLEAAMCGWLYEFADKPALLPKLDYYSRCIRDCFDTAGWPPVTLWEEPLNR